MTSRSWLAPAIALALLAGAPRPAAGVKVLAFGDSITYGIGDEEGLGYPKRLKKMLGKGSSVFNQGEPAEDTGLGLTRLRSVLGEDGDVVLLMEGTNDVTLIAEGSLSVETTLANIDAMISRVRDADKEPVLSSIIPRAPEARRDRTNEITSFLAGDLRELAIERNVRFADIYDIFDPVLVPTFFDEYYHQNPDDPIGHPNGAGYDRIASVFADLLNEVDSAPPVVGNFEPGPLPNTVPTGIKFEVPVYDFKSGSGLDLAETKLLLNGAVIATGAESEGDAKKVNLVHQDKKAIGCRVVLRVLAQDSAVPPNSLDRTIGIYDVTGRTVTPGDVNFDCRVDGADLVSFALRFGIDSSDPRYLLTWDFNRDGMIDETDLATLSSNFGKSSL